MGKSSIRKPKSPQGLATQEAILEASVQILLASGVEALNTNLIAERAGVSVGSLYQYFENKDEILLELLKRAIDARTQRVKDALNLSIVFASIEEIVAKVVDAIFEDDAKTEARLELLLFPIALNPKHRLWENQIQRVNDVIKPALKALLLIKEPGLRDRDLETVAFVLMQSVRGVLIGLALPHGRQLRSPLIKEELKRLLMGYLQNAGQKPARK
jgi:AcrR family transcriptional regulator